MGLSCPLPPPAGPKLTGVECVEGMATGLYEELFAALVSLINRYKNRGLAVVAVVVGCLGHV